MRSAHPLTKELRSMTSESRLAGLEASIGPRVSIEILWQTEKVRDMLFDRVLALLTRSLQPFPDEQKDDLDPPSDEEGEEDSENSLGEESRDDGFEMMSSTASVRSRRLARKRIPEQEPLP